ncbi:thiamine phosphate synthase, partial [Candidatus Aerophobetes bacterium]|nr:thiamine phosphate synthase [Candidatus Aerophobetes bacterium]
MYSHKSRIYRVIDANFNRATEGLRVLEDVARFYMNDENLTSEFKKMRHLFLEEIKSLPRMEKLIASRFALEDVGLKLKEKERKNLTELVEANFKRVEEAERTLEEFGKLISSSFGERFRQLRFKTYQLEKKMLLKLRKKVDYTLYAVTFPSLPEEKLFSQVKQAIEGGVTVIQLREKNLSSRQFLERAVKLREIIPPQVSFIVNDRVDVALCCDADGVHLGQDDLPVSSARQLMGDNKIIGVSTHNLEEAKKAEKEGADYIATGPVFSTSTKPDALSPIGCKLLSCIKKEVSIPVVAIGGISLENLKQVLDAGADGIAVVSAIFSSEDVK